MLNIIIKFWKNRRFYKYFKQNNKQTVYLTLTNLLTGNLVDFMGKDYKSALWMSSVLMLFSSLFTLIAVSFNVSIILNYKLKIFLCYNL